MYEEFVANICSHSNDIIQIKIIYTQRTAMRSITLTLLLSALSFTLLVADFYPPTVASSISSVNGKKIKLTKAFPAKGMSGVVIHNYGSELKAITSYITYNGGNSATLVKYEPIIHNSLPSVKPNIKTKDLVIGGYLYNNILLLAPDAQTYAKITSAAAKNWIHPDLYAIFLSKEGDQFPTKENLAKFSSKHQVGLVYIVKRGKGVLYDPISRRYVSQKKLQGLPTKGQFPFYMRLGKIDSGWFSRDAVGEYYQMMGAIK